MSDVCSVAALRPGALLGAYPEQDPARGAGDGAATSTRTLPAALRRTALRAFVRQVHQRAAGVAGLAPNEIGACIDALRQALVSDGLNDAVVARCFALVRELAGRELRTPHYDTQLMAGRVMLSGALAEMHTGEGKTLAATLPVCTAALAGIPVHVVTANDYLATRDAAAMGPLYRALGLTVGAVTADTPPPQRRAAYARDVVYTTSKQLAFDYLRDRLTLGERRGAAHIRVERLFNAQPRCQRVTLRGLCFAVIDEADSVLIDEARTPFVIARDVPCGDLEAHCQAALAACTELVETRDYCIDQAAVRVTLTERGQECAAALPDSVPQGRRLREALLEQALAARHIYRRDRDYLVRDGQVQIIDRQTGRVLPDRSWERGLHQMIECKEGCAVTAPRETLASLTFQRLFPRYLRLGGTTGTAREVADELRSTYSLPVVEIPTHRPSRRRALPLHVTRCADSKRAAIVAAVAREHADGRPVLIGTRTVEDSERLSAVLSEARLPHAVLNARQDAGEAAIVAAAGKAGQITVATNMAGRGTDIVLDHDVVECGGLHVILSEPNEERRLDRQLYGRCARQGQPGSWQMFACPDDDVMQRFGPPLSRAVLLAGTHANGAGKVMSRTVIHAAQRRCELHQRAVRKDLRTMQDAYDKLLAFAGERN